MASLRHGQCFLDKGKSSIVITGKGEEKKKESELPGAIVKKILDFWKWTFEQRDAIKGKLEDVYPTLLCNLAELTIPTFKQEDIITIVQRLFDGDNEDQENAREICNTYGRRGVHFLKELYLSHQS